MFIFNLFVNLIDFFIIYKFFSLFNNGTRRLQKKKCLLIFFACVLILSISNVVGIANINLILTILLMFSYSATFIFSRFFKIIIPISYIGIGMVAEVVSVVILQNIDKQTEGNINYIVANLLCEMLRAISVYVIGKIIKNKLENLSVKINILLIGIPVISVFVCYILMDILRVYNNSHGDMLCLIVVTLLFILNILVFEIFDKLLEITQEKNKQELFLAEAKSKEEYYKEIEENDKKVRSIRHDLKNKLLALSSDNQSMEDAVVEMISEIEMSENKIYTSNTLFNTIIKNKMSLAESKQIKQSVNVLLPQKLNVNYGDMGVLLGNLLDNAIEASEKATEKFIELKITYKEKAIFMSIKNSKANSPADIEKTSKKSKENHGFGINNIKNIVKKYDGFIEFNDKENIFEVYLSLNGIEALQ